MASVDTSRLSFGALVAAGGGLVLLLSLFLDWFGPLNAFDLFDLTDFLLLLIALAAIAFAAIQVTNTQVNLPRPASEILTLLGIVATTITFVYLIEGDERKLGLFLAFLASLAILIGGIVARKEPAGGLDLPVGGSGAGVGHGGDQGGGGYAAAPPAAAAGPLAGGGGAAPPPQQPAATEQMGAGGHAPPPGGKADWYADPEGKTRLRYYDGQRWTEHTAE